MEKGSQNIIKNLDEQVQLVVNDATLHCLSRTNFAVKQIGGEKRVGSLFLWDTTIKDFDSVWGFHVWLRKDSRIYDSHSAIAQALEAHTASGLDFGMRKPVSEWKVIELTTKGDKVPSVKYATQKMRKYRKQKVDAIYLEGFVNLEALKGVTEMARKITAIQQGRFTNESMLEALRNNNDI